MKLSKVIKKELIRYVNATTKDAALTELVDMLKTQNAISDAGGIKKMLFARESLMSTGIGLEIGVPHVRMEGITSPVLALGISKTGIADYGSLDNKPVKLIFMIIVNKGAHKEYIRLLAQIATLLKNEEARNELIHAASVDEIYSRLRA